MHIVVDKKAIICCSGVVNRPLLAYISERLLPSMNCETSHFLDKSNEQSSNACMTVTSVSYKSDIWDLVDHAADFSGNNLLSPESCKGLVRVSIVRN
jgi:hypothetical protein